MGAGFFHLFTIGGEPAGCLARGAGYQAACSQAAVVILPMADSRGCLGGGHRGVNDGRPARAPKQTESVPVVIKASCARRY
jgi:hypothetical protein